MKYVQIIDSEVVVVSLVEPANMDGWMEVPDDVFAGHRYASGAFSPPPPRAKTEDDIIAERRRRLAAGFDYDFGDPRGVHRIGTTDVDMAGWDEVTKYASALIAAGQGQTGINIVTDTGPVTVTADEWQMVVIAAAAFRQAIFAASFAMQAMVPIPDSFADDGYWQ